MLFVCHGEAGTSLGSGKACDMEETGGPANLQSVWDNVITWMRQAVEFVGLDKNADDDKPAEHGAVRRGVSLLVITCDYFEALYSNPLKYN